MKKILAWLALPAVWTIRGISAPFLLGLFWLLKFSCRCEVRGQEHLQASPVFIYCGWHEHFFNYGVACAPLPKDLRMTLVMGDFWYSRHLAWVVERMGAVVLFVKPRERRPGAQTADQPRGKSRLFAVVVERLAAGHSVAILPDGPHGPRRVIKDGVLAMAEQSGAPILPIRAVAHKPYIVPNTWDRKGFPLPFTRVTVDYLPPIWVRNGDREGAKAALARALADPS